MVPYACLSCRNRDPRCRHEAKHVYDRGSGRKRWQANIVIHGKRLCSYHCLQQEAVEAVEAFQRRHDRPAGASQGGDPAWSMRQE